MNYKKAKMNIYFCLIAIFSVLNLTACIDMDSEEKNEEVSINKPYYLYYTKANIKGSSHFPDSFELYDVDTHTYYYFRGDDYNIDYREAHYLGEISEGKITIDKVIAGPDTVGTEIIFYDNDRKIRDEYHSPDILSEEEWENSPYYKNFLSCQDIYIKKHSYDKELSHKYTIVSFGEYEQDGIEENGKEKIRWILIGEKDEKAYLLSVYVLAGSAWGEHKESDNDCNWQNSLIRSWLNEEFCREAFSEDERAVIKDIKDNERKTSDKVRLLDWNDELVKVNLESRYTYSTDTVKNVEESSFNGQVDWWLLNEKDNLSKYYWDKYGTLQDDYWYEEKGVRPVICIDCKELEKYIVSSTENR